MGVVEALGNIADILVRMAPEKVATLKADDTMSERVEVLVLKKKKVSQKMSLLNLNCIYRLTY